MPKTRISRLDLTEINRAVLAIEDEIARVREQFGQLRSGKLPFTGDLDLGTFRITNTGTAESDDDTLTLGELQDRIFDIEEAELQLETSSAGDTGSGAKAGRLARRTSQLSQFAAEAASQITANVVTPGVVFVDAAGDLDTDEVNFVWDDTNNRLGLLTATPTHTLHVATGGLVRIADLTAGSIVFAGTSGVLSQDNANLFWDDTTNRLGLLDATPSATLSIGATSQFQVDSTGNLVRINDIPYSWPAVQGAVNTVLRNDGAGVLTWVTTAALGIDHGTLLGLTDDDHPQYLLLAGRAGGQTANGGTAAADDLHMRANTAAQAIANAGRIRLNDRVELWDDIPDFTGTNITHAARHAATLTITGAAGNPALHVFRSSPTITFTGAGGTLSTYRGFSNEGTITAAGAGSTTSTLTAIANDLTCEITGTSHTILGRAVNGFPTYRTSLTSTSSSSQHIGLESFPTLTASGVNASLSFGAITGAFVGGELITDDATGVVTTSSWTGLYFADPTATGPGTATITTLRGILVEDLTIGTTNLSLQSLGTAVEMRHAGPIQLGNASTSGFITGSTATAGDLSLSGTTADQNGQIRVQDELTLREDWPASAVGVDKYACSFTPAMTLSSAGGDARTFYVAPTGTISVSASYQCLAWEPVMTMAASGANAAAVQTLGEFTYEATGANFRLFRAQTTLSANDSIFAPPNGQIFLDNTTYLSEGVAAGTTATIRSFQSNFTAQASDTSVWALTTVDGFHVNFIIDEDAGATLNVTNLRGIFIGPTILGTPQITNVAGISIGTLPTGSTETISLRSTPSNAEMRHVGDAKFGVDAATSAKVHITEQTVGDEVLRVESVATADDPNYIVRQYRVETTNATVTTLGAITLNASQTTMIEARVVARRTAGAAGTAEDGLGVVVRGGYKMVGGAATALTNGTPTTDFETDDQAAWTATLDTSGATVRIRVTGALDNTVTWHATAIIQTVGT